MHDAFVCNKILESLIQTVDVDKAVQHLTNAFNSDVEG